MDNLNEELAIAVEAAAAAGEEIMKVYRSHDFEVSLKSDHSPLTLADRQSDKIINDKLAITPFPVLSEESGSHDFRDRSGWKRFWLVDPLDGTKEFISRNDEFTVNIALVDDGKPVLGVIYLPVFDLMYLGLHSNGAYRLKHFSMLGEKVSQPVPLLAEGEKLPLPKQQTHSVLVSRSHLSPATLDYLHHLETLTGPLQQITAGSSLKLCRIAEGTAGIYPRMGPTMEWDIGAGMAIVQASGGKITTLAGRPLQFNKTDLTNPWFIAASRNFGEKYPGYLRHTSS